MHLSRRHFLQQTARASAGIALAGALGFDAQRLFAGLSAAGNPLRIPSLFTGGDLTAGSASLELWPGTSTQLWTLNGNYPAPTIRVRRGSEFSARLVNNLDEPTILHWHGLFTPAGMDGHPRDAIQPGANREYRFTVNQRAATCWYHPHPDMHTAEQVYRGMAGFFIIEDDEEAALGLPDGEFDVPLMIQDRRVSASHQFEYQPDETSMRMGMLGDTILVNGTPDPVLSVSRDLYRFRLLNGSNARVYHIALDDESAFHLIGNDGGLLDAPVSLTQLSLSPGERVDILVDFSGRTAGQSVVLTSVAFGGAVDALNQGWPFPLLRFDVTAEARATRTVPATLATVERLDPSQSKESRLFILAASGSGGNVEHTINGQTFDMLRVDVEAEAATVEAWTFTNFTGAPHPMHVHGASFQVQTRNGSADDVRPEERGWKDTVLVDQTTSVEVLVKFGTEEGLFLVHCHNLEHEDHGMMSNVQIGKTNGVADATGLKLKGLSPNPASERARLSFSTNQPGTLVVDCIRSDGQQMARLAEVLCETGEQSIALDLQSIPPGRYILDVVLQGKRSSLPLVVVR